MFPPTFLYTQSWEDPRADEPYLQAGPGDVCLTLTSGGCNSLHLCIAGARKASAGGGVEGLAKGRWLRWVVGRLARPLVP